VKTVTYSKPEVFLLGNAACLIQTDVGKADFGDAGSMTAELSPSLES
jgi:hypothetical protein